MPRWTDITRLRLRSLLHRDQVDEELRRELRAHIEQQAAEYVTRGLPPDEAYREAVRTFGGIDHVTEEARDARGWSIVDNLLRDLRYSLRGLLREPILLLAATTSIALGAGGNIAVLSLAKEFVFARPDARRPEELVQMRVSHGSHVTYQRWLDLDASDALAGIAGYSLEKQVNWLDGDAAVSITPMLVTANFFDVTGVPVAQGRAFTTAEARAEVDPRVAIVSHRFWQGELRADPAVVGRGLVLNGESYTIVGVLPARLRSVAGFAIAPGVYVPVNRSLVPEMLTPDARIVQLVGRLKPGQELAQGRAQVNAVDRRLGRLERDTLYAGVQEFAPLGALTGKGTVIGGFFALLGLVSLFVLLIACANVAGLLIARGTARRREIAIRLALGGTRTRLLQQFLVEGFWLSLLGTAGGLLLSFAFMKVVNGITLPIPVPFDLQLAPDATIMLGALGLVLLSMVLSSLLPALGATRLVLTPSLKREEPQYANRRFSARSVLLAGQVTVSTVLLVTAFLFVRNLTRTQFTDPGFEVERSVVAELGFLQGNAGAPDPLAILDAAVEKMRGHPGVTAAAYSNAVPLTVHGGSTSGVNARIDGGDPRHIEFALTLPGPGYFMTSGTRILQGREFLATDRAGAPEVGVVNEEFVRRYVGGGNAVGTRVQVLSRDNPMDFTVIGVVANGKHRTLGEEQRAAIYRPLRQQPEGLKLGYVIVRTQGDPAPMLAAVRAALGEVDRTMAVDVKPMRAALALAFLPSQVGAAVLGSLGVLGLILAMFGLFAIVSYTVSRRISEIAIRVALGATNRGILRLVIRDVTVLVGIGVALGLVIAAIATRPLSVFLVTGLSATDPVSFAGTAVAFVIVSVLASWLPARRAIRVSPVIAMRLD